jgi:hypothetical protein
MRTSMSSAEQPGEQTNLTDDQPIPQLRRALIP